METGWIKIHRKLLEWEWYRDTNMVRLWIHLLLNANIKDRKWKGKVIPKGSLVTSLTDLSDKTGMSKQELRTCIKRLKKTKEITCSPTNRYTIVTICNYEAYQVYDGELQHAGQQPGNTQTTHGQHTNNTPIIEEGKEIKEEKEYFDSLRFDLKRFGDDWAALIGQWLYFQYANGKPFKTQSSVNLMVNKLVKLSNNDINTARLIVEQSMANNWSGLFALKDKPETDGYKGDSTLGTDFQRKT